MKSVLCVVRYIQRGTHPKRREKDVERVTNLPHSQLVEPANEGEDEGLHHFSFCVIVVEEEVVVRIFLNMDFTHTFVEEVAQFVDVLSFACRNENHIKRSRALLFRHVLASALCASHPSLH